MIIGKSGVSVIAVIQDNEIITCTLIFVKLDLHKVWCPAFAFTSHVSNGCNVWAGREIITLNIGCEYLHELNYQLFHGSLSVFGKLLFDPVGHDGVYCQAIMP